MYVFVLIHRNAFSVKPKSVLVSNLSFLSLSLQSDTLLSVPTQRQCPLSTGSYFPVPQNSLCGVSNIPPHKKVPLAGSPDFYLQEDKEPIE